jgi:hypothetical protein
VGHYLNGGHVHRLREVVAQGLDEPLHQEDARLSCILDPEFRTFLLSNTSSAKRALLSGQWKTATVLASSVIEALCLWLIRTKKSEHETKQPMKYDPKPLFAPARQLLGPTEAQRLARFSRLL